MHSIVFPTRTEFRRRDLLPLQQNHLWRIESGYVRSLFWTEEGDVVTLGIWGAGEVIGKPFTSLQGYQLECLTPVTISLFIADSSATQAAFQHYLQQVEIMLMLVHTRSISPRLWRVLQWLVFRFGYPVEQGWLLEMPLTHQTLAELIGTTRVTVTRLLADLGRAGKLRLLKRHQLLLPGFNPAHAVSELER